MSWEIFALASALFYGLMGLLQRHIMKKESSIAMSFSFQLVSALIFLPFAFSAPLPGGYLPWLIVLAASFLWVAENLAGFESLKRTEISLRAPVGKISVLFVFFLSVLALNESVTLQKTFGTALIFFGLVILTWRGKLFGGFSDKGVRLTVLAAAVYSIIVITDRFALNYFPIFAYSFLVYFIPMLMVAPLAVRNKAHVKKLFLRNKLPLLFAALLGASGYYLQLAAYKLTEVSNVIPVIELSVLVSVSGGYIFHKEKELKPRLAGALFMLAGSVLILKPSIVM